MRAFIIKGASMLVAVAAMLLLTAGTPQAAMRPGAVPVIAAPLAPAVDRAELVQPIQYYYGRRYYRPRHYGYRGYYRPRHYGYRGYYRPRYYGYRRY